MLTMLWNKILNSKIMMKSLTLKGLQVKKIFQTTKEFKENLQIEFTKNHEVLKNKIFADPLFDSEKIEFNDINVEELLDIQHSQLSSRVERCTYEG